MKVSILDSDGDSLTDELLNKAKEIWNKKELCCDDLKVLALCAEEKPDIIEKNVSCILNVFLSQRQETFEGIFLLSYTEILGTILEIFSKLQRVHKFILLFLQCVKDTSCDLSLGIVIPECFIVQFCNTVTLLPSLQSLTLLEGLLQELNDACVQPLRESHSTANALHTQVTCELLVAYMQGARMLSQSIPQSILDSFLAHMDNLQQILNVFGTSLLTRTHDPEMMWPFLKTCFYWGEIQILIMYYTPEHFGALSNKDTDPTDLSVLHSYLDGGQWNVLAERIFNFGAGQCNKNFLKLVLQKLRLSKLAEVPNIANMDATSKYIVLQLTSDLYKHNIVKELTTDDIRLILSSISWQQSRVLIEKLFDQLQEHQDGLKEWILNPALQENRDFVVHFLALALNKIGCALDAADEYQVLKGTNEVLTSPVLFDENDAVNPDKLDMLSKNVNIALANWKSTSNLITKKKKLNNIKHSVDVMMMLPLNSMGSEIRSLTMLTCTCLAVVCCSEKNLVKSLICTMNSLVANSVDSCAGLDIGLCIKWLFEEDFEELKDTRRRLAEALVKASPNTGSGLAQLEKLVKMLRKRKRVEEGALLETEVFLYESLGKCWARPKSHASQNDLIGEFRADLWDAISAEMGRSKEGSCSDVLLKAYCIQLRKLASSKDDAAISSLIQLNFASYLDAAIYGIKKDRQSEGCVSFLSTVLLCMPQIRTYLPEGIVLRIWSAFNARHNVDWHLIASTSSNDEFRTLLSDLAKMTKERLTDEEATSENLKICFDVWRCFFENDCEVKKEMCQNTLEPFFCYLESAQPQLQSLPVTKTLPLLRFLRFCVATTRVHITSSMLDATFDVMFTCQLNHITAVSEFGEIFTSLLDIAAALLVTRKFRIKDKIPSVFQLFVFLLNHLVKKSDVSLHGGQDVDILANCAFFMEKWTNSMKKLERDFARVVAYFIAEIVSCLTRTTIHEPVKIHLCNCVNNFLSISDEHAVTFLLRAFSPPCGQVFKNLYRHFKKYYKFTGKV